MSNEIEVSVKVRRMVDRYSSDTLADLRIEESVPLTDDHAAIKAVQLRIDDGLTRVTRTMDARIQFDDTVRQIESGGESEVIDY